MDQKTAADTSKFIDYYFNAIKDYSYIDWY